MQAVFSYPGSSQSRADTEGQPSPVSSPRTPFHGQQPRPPRGGGCMLLVRPSYKIQPAGKNKATVSANHFQGTKCRQSFSWILSYFTEFKNLCTGCASPLKLNRATGYKYKLNFWIQHPGASRIYHPGSSKPAKICLPSLACHRNSSRPRQSLDVVYTPPEIELFCGEEKSHIPASNEEKVSLFSTSALLVLLYILRVGAQLRICCLLAQWCGYLYYIYSSHH